MGWQRVAKSTKRELGASNAGVSGKALEEHARPAVGHQERIHTHAREFRVWWTRLKDRLAARGMSSRALHLIKDHHIRVVAPAGGKSSSKKEG